MANSRERMETLVRQIRRAEARSLALHEASARTLIEAHAIDGEIASWRAELALMERREAARDLSQARRFLGPGVGPALDEFASGG